MGTLKEIALDDRYLERLGFAVSAFEYFCALEESSLIEGFREFWPSMVCSAMHIQHAGYDDLRGIGEDFFNRYLSGCFGYVRGRSTPVILDAPVVSDVCGKIVGLQREGECAKLAVGE